MEKGKANVTHWILFVVAILAVGISMGPSILSSLAERNDNNGTKRMGGGPGGGPGGGMGGMGGPMTPQQVQTMNEERLTRMTQELTLTADQQAKVKAIFDSTTPRMSEIRNNNSLSRQQKMEQMKPIRDDMQNQIKQVLTPDQQTKYEAMRAQMRGRMGGGPGGGGPGGGGPGGRMGGGGGYPGYPGGGYPGGNYPGATRPS